MVHVLKHLPGNNHLYYGSYAHDPAKNNLLNDIYQKYPTDIVLFEDVNNELDYKYVIVFRFKNGSKGSEKLHRILMMYDDLQYIFITQYSLRRQGSGDVSVVCKEVIDAVPMKPETKKHFGDMMD